MTTDQLRHVLCGQTFETIEEFNRHVGTSGPPDFENLPPLCAVLLGKCNVIYPDGRRGLSALAGSEKSWSEVVLEAEKRYAARTKEARQKNALRQRRFRRNHGR